MIDKEKQWEKELESELEPQVIEYQLVIVQINTPQGIEYIKVRVK